MGIAFALALAGPAAATTGANEPGDIGVEPTQIIKQPLGSLAGYYLAARHARLNQDISSAAGFYVSALSKDAENTELLDSSVILSVASGNIGQAVTLSKQLLETEPEDWIALTTVATDQIRKGEHDAARETLETLNAVGGQIQELVAGLLEAWVLAAEGNAQDAVDMLGEMEGPAWYEPFVTLHAGLIADLGEIDETAVALLGASYERDPGSPRVMEAYVRSLARAGAAGRASEILDQFEARLGGSDQYTATVRAALEAGDVEGLITRPVQGASEALYGLGTAYARDGGNAQAAALFQLALYLSPDSYFSSMALGQVMESLRQHQAAIQIYREVPERHPLSRSARVQEALNLNILDRNDEAIALLQTAVEQDPSDLSTTIVLGNIYRATEAFDEAENTYSKAIEALGNVPTPYWTLYYYRGIARERIDDWTGAERDFRLALTYQPDNAHTLNYLGYSLVDRGEKLDEAIDMVRRAVSAEPSNGYIVDSLGWAYYRLGRYEDAVRELERAVNLKPIDPVINDHLGDAYWQVGRKREAMFQWSHAKDFGPDDKLAAEIDKKLAEGLAPATSVQHAAAAERAAAEKEAESTE